MEVMQWYIHIIWYFLHNGGSKIIIFTLYNAFMDKYIAACNVLTPPTFRWLMIGLQVGPPTEPSHF